MRLVVLSSLLLSVAPVSAQNLPVELDVTAPNKAPASLEARFSKLQQIARAGLPPYSLRIVAADQSLLAQQSDGFLRLPESALRIVRSDENLDALMLIGLSYATHKPTPRPSLSKAAQALAGVAGFIGYEAAASRYETTGGSPLDYLAQPDYRGPDQTRKTFSPALRGFSWAKAAGGCEATIITGLRALAAGNRPSQISLDSQKILRELGPVAWTPDDRCRPQSE